MEIDFQRVHKVVRELENEVKEGKEIDIQNYVNKMNEAYEELCSELLLPFVLESFLALYEGKLNQMDADLKNIQKGEVSQELHPKTARIMLTIFHKLVGITP